LNVCYWLVLIVLISTALLTMLSAMKLPGGYRMYVVQSGSMEPKIHVKSIVFVKPAADYKVGDVITFNDPSSAKRTVTHRIYEITQNQSGADVITTKGDTNNAPDASPLQRDNIIGKEFFSAPYIGAIVAFSKTLLGLIFLIVIPAILIVFSELQTIGKEAKRLSKKHKKRKLNAP
jgi:signal peptidase I